MPWDRYSLTGSVGRHQGRNTIFSSGGVSGGLNLGGLGGASIFSSSIHGGSQLGDHGRRPRVNASPLLGRGRRSLGSLGIDNGLGIDGHILSGKDDEELYLGAGEDDPQLPLGGDDNLDPYGDNYMTQPADGSTQWLNATMERESYNFLEYLRNELSSRLDEPVFDATNPTLRAITLDQLVPPKESRVIVAAQAMHHTLLLATKGLIRVRQEKAFGDIYLMMPQSQVPRLGNGEDELEEGAEVEEEPLGTTPVPERRREMSLRD